MSFSLEYLVVAGGGRGQGGGGGAGDVLSGSLIVSPNTEYPITVGAGGTLVLQPGGDSIFSTITAKGGGGGAAFNNNGGGGGSGGGAARDSGASRTGGVAIGNGNNGGNASGTGGGGGGGASTAGGNNSSGTGAAGGLGVASSISGSSVTYGGGGGGGGSSSGGSGGSGGGGNGSRTSSTSGSPNTGGGGGGNWLTNGSSGGSGIIIIRYLSASVAEEGTGGTITNVGDYTIHTFTSSGTFVSPDFLSPPQNLTATTNSNNQIDLDWDLPSSDGGSEITGYKIERESPVGGGFSTIVANTGNTNTTYSNTGLNGGTQYNYRVSAINSDGTSSPSNESSDITLSDTPGNPTNLSATTVDAENIDLSWDAPEYIGLSAIIGYKIERESPTGNGFSTIVANTNNTNTTYSDSGLTHNTEYNYRVSAINSDGIGNPSDADSATTDDATPGAPTNLSATLINSTQIDLSWDAPVDDGGFDIVGYKIEVKYRTGDSYETLVEDTESSIPTYSHLNFIQSTVLSYRVYSINSVATSTSASDEYTLNINDQDCINFVDENTELFLPFDEDLTDYAKGHTPLSSQNISIETDNPKFGNGYLLGAPGDVNGGHINYGASSDFKPEANEDFTIEFWVRPQGGVSPFSTAFPGFFTIFNTGDANKNIIEFKITGVNSQSPKLNLNCFDSTDTQIPDVNLQEPSVGTWNNQWYHIVAERYGNIFSIYKDGVIVASTTIALNLKQDANSRTFLATDRLGNLGSPGTVRIDNFKYCVGVARYKHHAFTQPTKSYCPFFNDVPPTDDGVLIKLKHIEGRVYIDLLTGDMYIKTEGKMVLKI